jgi:hypothetical protein
MRSGASGGSITCCCMRNTDTKNECIRCVLPELLEPLTMGSLFVSIVTMAGLTHPGRTSTYGPEELPTEPLNLPQCHPKYYHLPRSLRHHLEQEFGDGMDS